MKRQPPFCLIITSPLNLIPIQIGRNFIAVSMIEWKQPHRRPLKCNEPSALGVINRKYFESATWEPLLSTEIGRGQYSRFVASIVERIRSKESSCDEIRSFLHLIAVCTCRSRLCIDHATA